jgi:hypothetical protein
MLVIASDHVIKRSSVSWIRVTVSGVELFPFCFPRERLRDPHDAAEISSLLLNDTHKSDGAVLQSAAGGAPMLLNDTHKSGTV